MAWRYRDSESGQYVSVRTWNRSHAQGGERYKRESDIHYGEEKPIIGGPDEGIPSEPTTAEEYDRYYDDYDGDFEDQGEVETGVDY